MSDNLQPMDELEGAMNVARFNRFVEDVHKMALREFPGCMFGVQLVSRNFAPMLGGTLMPGQVLGLLGQLWNAQMSSDPKLQRIVTERPPT